MTDRPYTDDDLRAEAARQLATLAEHLDADRVGQAMCGSEIESRRPEPGDGAPTANGCDWDVVLDDGQFDDAEQAVHRLIKGAADVSAWSVGLGADGLQPSPDEINLDGDDDRPFIRIHFAFHPDMTIRDRQRFALGVQQVIAHNL